MQPFLLHLNYMKKRFSHSKAEWTESREEEYRKYCDEILFNKKLELIIKGNGIYLKSENKEVILLKVDKPKSMWFEIWLKLK